LLQDIGVKPKTAVVDMGYRGADADIAPVELIHRGKYRPLNAQQRRWLKRRQAIEPTIGHIKHDHRMDKCWLKGSEGDALHAVLCAAGFNPAVPPHDVSGCSALHDRTRLAVPTADARRVEIRLKSFDGGAQTTRAAGIQRPAQR
jgi:hypothetical protein